MTFDEFGGEKSNSRCEQERKCIQTIKMSHPPPTNILKLSQIFSLHLSKTMASAEEDDRTQDKAYYGTDDYLIRFHH
jgi:hypothetical protein